MPTYDQAWDLNLENIQNIYRNKQDYIDSIEGGQTDPNYQRPEYKEDGHYVETDETIEGEHRRRPYKIENGKKKYTGPWEVYTP